MKNSILDLIGNTPLVKLKNYNNIYGKLEYFNPFGSIKDRTALYLIKDGEQSGKLKIGNTIIEPTSGNTGIGLAFLGKQLGYNVEIVIPKDMSMERKLLLNLADAEVTEIDGSISETINYVKNKIKNSNRYYFPNQFENSANWKAHFETTGLEIWKETLGKFDFLVAGVGTGGTITGIGRVLKELSLNINIIAVEPKESAVLSGNSAGKHGIQGIGAGFIPSLVDMSVIDDIVTITTEEAYSGTKYLFKNEGINAGISSGAALIAAKKIQEKFPEKKIVTIFPDTGTRYLSLLK